MRFEPKLYVKGLILVAVPLLFEVVFGITLLNLQGVYEQALEEEARSKELIYYANEMWLCSTDAVTSVFEMRMLRPDAAKDVKGDVRRLNKAYAALSELVKDDRKRKSRVDGIMSGMNDLMDISKKFGEARPQAGTSQISLLVGSFANFKRLRGQFELLNDQIRAFRDPILIETLKLRAHVKQVQETISRITVLSIAGSVLLAAGLYIYFMKGINRGIQVLLTNTKRLKEAETLLPVLNTQDELGEVDRSFHQMADTLRERTIELERVNTELSRSNGDLQQFAYVASHDLQAPLRAVSSYLDILKRRHGSALETDAQSLVQKAEDGAKRMQLLIRDLLAYARVDSSSRELVPVDCNQVIRIALENLKVVIEENEGTVSFDQLPVVIGDSSQLTQLFQNLIGNAIKFRKEEPPHVQVSAVESDGKWEFSVKDNGIGMDMANADRVFTIFKRLQTKQKYEGTGIGLAICKKIVEGHGGKIWIESEPGVGTTFKFTLPAAVKEEAAT